MNIERGNPILKHAFVKSLIFVSLVALTSVGCFSKARLKVGESDDGEVVEAVGYAPHDASDLLATKEASLKAAQRSAVEKVVGVFVSARTMVERSKTIENNILGQTEGWLKKYEILEKGVEGGLYRTKIRALVAFRDLEMALKDNALLNAPELQRPLVFIQITEEIEDKKASDPAGATALENALIGHGYPVVHGEREKEAELRIQGKATAYPFQSKNLGGFISYRARMSLKVLRTGTDDVLVSMTKEASGLGGNNELAGLKALESVGALMADAVAEKLSEKLGKGKRLLVFVEGVKSFKEVDRIKKHFISQPGVSDLVLRRYEEEMAQFEVQLGSIGPTDLATSLEASKNYPMTVLETKAQTLRLKVN